MAELGGGDGGHGGKHEKKRPKKSSGRVDMTPMVDLGFLLLTFFVLTSTLKEPKVMELVVPAKKPPEGQKPTQFPAERTINLLLAGNNKIYWYMGKKPDQGPPDLARTLYSDKGLRKVLLDHNQRLNKEVEALVKQVEAGTLPEDSLKPKISKLKMTSMTMAGGQYGLLAVIKPTDNSTYKNLVDVFDELNIANVANKALVKPEPWELDALKMAP